MTFRVRTKKKFKGLITEDGEVVHLDLILSAFIPRNPRDTTPYVKVYGEKVLEAIRKKKLKASELEVFLWFIGKSSRKDYWHNEWIVVDYRELGEELGLNADTVRKAIKTLLKLKFIVQWKPRKTAFRLNPDYCFKGGVVLKEQVKLEDILIALKNDSKNKKSKNKENEDLKSESFEDFEDDDFDIEF